MVKAAGAAGPGGGLSPARARSCAKSRSVARPRSGSRPTSRSRFLRSIVDATVGIFAAEAASIALLDDATGELRFVVAAGAQGQPVVGLTIPATQGVAGYVFSTGESIAMTDPARTRGSAAAVAESDRVHVPRSILAVPLEDGVRTIGVLEVFDKRAGPFYDAGHRDRVALRPPGRDRDQGRRADARGAVDPGRRAARMRRRVEARRGRTTAARHRAGLRRDRAAVRRRPVLGLRRRDRGDAPRVGSRPRPRDRPPDASSAATAHRDQREATRGLRPSPPVSEELLPAWSEPFTADRQA